MKAIFLGTDEKKISKMFIKKYLDEYLNDLLPLNIYTKKDIVKNKNDFINVKYIFSTWNMPVFNEEEIRRYFPSLQAIFYAAGSVKYFADPFFNCGVKIFSSLKANSIPVAEFVVSQIILANKGYFQALRKYRRPFYKLAFFNARRHVLSKKGNYYSKIGIIGFGNIGKKVVELLKPYNLKIYVSDPFVNSEIISKYGGEKVTLKELFMNCDVITNHLPDIKETEGVLDYSLFGSMKDNATFINTGRGNQIIEKDLIKILKKNPHMTALLDVTKHEPLFPWSKLYYMKNVFITPHIAGSFNQEEYRLVENICEAYSDFKKGKINECEIKKEDLKKMT